MPAGASRTVIIPAGERYGTRPSTRACWASRWRCRVSAPRSPAISASPASRGKRPESGRQAEAYVREVVTEVARQLGNTPAAVRKCYLHPAVVDAYQAGALEAGKAQSSVLAGTRLSLAERQLLALLRREAAQGPLRHLKPSGGLGLLSVV